jgi:general secretion pathway protein F
MAAFRYEAYDAAGRLKKGVLEADTARQLRARLREQGLLVAEVATVSEATMARGSNRWHWRRGLSGTQLSLVTRQFATLLAAGLPVEQTLNALIEQADTDYQRQVLAGVRGEVLAGHSLARALQKYPRVFPELYVTLVAAGEQSGRLGEVMERLADYTESHQALRQKVGLAFIYPAIVTLVAGTVVLGLLTYVVPQVVSVFQNTNQTLPWLTRALIGLSDFLRASGWLWLIAITVAIWAARRALRLPPTLLRFHR